MRRQFSLPEEDVDHLDGMGNAWETVIDSGNRWLLIERFAYPTGFNVSEGSVAVQIPPNYATSPLDMAYFFPQLSRTDGRQIRQAQVMQLIDGRQWQRWSRHYRWIPGQHNLGTHLVLVARWLQAAAQ